MSQPLVKIAGSSLETVRARVPLPAAATEAQGDSTDVAAAVDRLEAAGCLLEATRFVAHALPKCEAVWWACMSATHTAPADLPDVDCKAREAAEDWVRQHGDNPRRAAWALAQVSGFGTPEAWRAVALAAVRGDVTRQQARLRRFLESGRNIAAGGPGRLPAEMA